ncbi:rRNA-processing endoribonuclease [Chytridiales sp. JEL 0842]|nr:rRNA-processing endoribonuclease [Chytridiales sp. JEL 0842]
MVPTTTTTTATPSSIIPTLTKSGILRFEGHKAFRQRLVLSILSGKSVRIDRIRADNEDAPGLADYEISFLRLLEKITNGSTVEISYTGTSVLFRPGVILNGKITHDCPPSRAVGYFLEPILALAPFGKSPLVLTLNGITNDNVDICVDTLRTCTLPTLKKFLPPTATERPGSLDLKITARGAPPLGGGSITFTCPSIRQLKPTQLLDLGKGVSKIRGIAYATRISPQMANRVVDAARSVLTRYIPDVYIYTDVYKGAESGKCPGYGVSLVAETTSGCLYSAECFYQPRKKLSPSSLEDQQQEPTSSGLPIPHQQQLQQHQQQEKQERDHPTDYLEESYTPPTPEHLGIRASRLLLTEIRKSGCVDTLSQSLPILYLSLGPEDVNKVRLGRLSAFSVQLLRDVRSFLGVTFKVVEEGERGETCVLSCVGVGYVNVNKNVQ